VFFEGIAKRDPSEEVLRKKTLENVQVEKTNVLVMV